MNAMKKTKTNNLRCWAIGMLAILLLATPSAWAQYVSVDCYPEGSPHRIDADDIDGLNIWTGATVNLYTSVPFVYVSTGGILNIYAGSIIDGLYIGTVVILTDDTDAIVTVYGTDFQADWNRDGTIVSLEGATEFMPHSTNPNDTYGSLLIATDKNKYPMNLLCFSNTTPINLVDLDLKKNNDVPIEIDIKPGSNPNSINLKSRGVVPVALLSEGDFKAGDIDPGSVEFAGASPVRSTLCDVDDDGDSDMVFHFKTKDLVKLNEESTEAKLTFMSTGGEKITVTDSVRIVPCKKNKKKNHHLSDRKDKKKHNYFSDKKSDKKHKSSKKNTTKHKRPVRNHKGR